MSGKARNAALCAILTSITLLHANAASWYVSQFGNDSRDGTLPQGAFKSIGRGIEAAEDGDTVVLLPGSHEGSASINGKAITLRSLNPRDPETAAGTVLVSRIYVSDVQSGECSIAGLTLHVARGCRYSGGIGCSNSNITISDCVIHGDIPVEAYDGGVSCEESVVTITGCTIAGHGSIAHGGIECAGVTLSDSQASIRDCLIQDNVGPGVAGIGCVNSEVTIEGCSIHDNASLDDQGNLYIDESSNVSLRNCAIYANIGGPAIRCSGDGSITNCTLFGNEGGISGNGGTRVVNCILWNRGNELVGCWAEYTCVSGKVAGEGNISLFPHFVNPGIGDFRLRSWSPCIDAGTPYSEYVNESSPNGGRVNMGAYGNTRDAASASADSDGDRLPDDWEVYWFGHLEELAKNDPDGDGSSNLGEYLSGGNPTAETTVYYVDSLLGDDRLSGRIPLPDGGLHGPTANVRAAVGLARDGDTVEVAPGRYYERLDFLGKSLHVRGTAGPETTIIDAYLSGPVFTVRPWDERPSVILEGLCLTNGWANRESGIYCEDASVLLRDCAVASNFADGYSGSSLAVPGAITFVDAEVTIQGCEVRDNASDRAVAFQNCEVMIEDSAIHGNGAVVGLIVCEDCIVMMVGCDVHNNTLGRGSYGTVYLRRSTATFVDCQIWDNQPWDPEYSYVFGGVYARASKVELRETVLARNASLSRSGYGGVRAGDGGELRIANCTFTGSIERVSAGDVKTDISNSLFLSDRPIYCGDGGTLRVANCTFYSQEGNGPAVSIGGEDVPVDVTNCIFSGYGYGSGKVPLRFCCVDWEAPGEGNIQADPRFVDPGANDFRLLPDSPGIDRGSLAAVLRPEVSMGDEEAILSWSTEEDLDGNPRISNSGVDMGAYEFQGNPASFVVEHSHDLETWNEGGTTTGFEWVDDLIGSMPWRFYRVRLAE